MRLLLGTALLSVAAVLAFTRPAHAQVELSFPSTCGSDDAFVAELRERHGIGADDVTLSSIRIAARDSSVYLLTVEGPEGTREIVDSDCQTLRRTALVIAAASAQPPRSGDAVLNAKPKADEVSRSVEPAFNARSYWAGAGGGVEVNLAPHPAWLIEVHGALASGPVGVSVAGRYLPPNTADELTDQQHGLRFEALGVRLGLMYRPARWARVEAALGVDRLRAEGRGVRRPSSDNVWLAAPDLELTFIPLRWQGIAWELAIRGRVAINRPRFIVEPDAVEVYRLPRFGATGLFRMNWGGR